MKHGTVSTTCSGGWQRNRRGGVSILFATAILVSAVGAERAFAHSEEEEQAPVPFLSYQVANDGNVNAIWTPSAKSYPMGEFATVEVLLPADLPKVVKDAFANVKNGQSSGLGVFEIVIIANGSLYGTRCHDVGGDYHCHQRSN